jgi:hypothetical protein
MDIRNARLALCAGAFLAGLAHGQAVAPPPLPLGSSLARPEPGMSEPERKRALRAHHHKFQQGKDYTRDDSIHGHESVSTDAARPVNTGTGTVPGGAGAGPGREKTDKGASSYFFGNDKK